MRLMICFVIVCFTSTPLSAAQFRCKAEVLEYGKAAGRSDNSAATKKASLLVDCLSEAWDVTPSANTSDIFVVERIRTPGSAAPNTYRVVDPIEFMNSLDEKERESFFESIENYRTQLNSPDVTEQLDTDSILKQRRWDEFRTLDRAISPIQ